MESLQHRLSRRLRTDGGLDPPIHPLGNQDLAGLRFRTEAGWMSAFNPS
jgi:hypothetical protein